MKRKPSDYVTTPVPTKESFNRTRPSDLPPSTSNTPPAPDPVYLILDPQTGRKKIGHVDRPKILGPDPSGMTLRSGFHSSCTLT